MASASTTSARADDWNARAESLLRHEDSRVRQQARRERLRAVLVGRIVSDDIARARRCQRLPLPDQCEDPTRSATSRRSAAGRRITRAAATAEGGSGIAVGAQREEHRLGAKDLSREGDELGALIAALGGLDSDGRRRDRPRCRSREAGRRGPRRLVGSSRAVVKRGPPRVNARRRRSDVRGAARE